MRKLLIPAVVISLITVAFVTLLTKIPLFQSAENNTFDFRIDYFSPKTEVSDKIVMIWLDEETILNLPYRSPVPRDFLATLNEKLTEAGPLLIAYDIFLEDPTIEESDKSLATSLSKWDTFAVSSGKELPDGKWVEEKPLKLFADSLKGFALSDLPINAYDATVRKFKPFWELDGKERPTFAALLYKNATGDGATEELIDSHLKFLGLNFKTYQRQENGEIWSFIRYAGPPSKIGSETNTFPVFPANLVAAGLIPPQWLTGKIVLIGSAYEFSSDAFLTPFFSKRHNYARMNGVEIHANILNGLLTESFYYLVSRNQELALFLVIALIISLISLRWKLGFSLAILFLIPINYLLLTIWIFKKLGLVIPVISPIVVCFFSFGSSLAWRSVTEGRQKRFIKGAFSKYVPTAVVGQMLHDPSKLVLGGETREITSLFTDIESFTTISERLTPDVLVLFLNDYLSKISNAIIEHGGTIDKYEGDAVIAIFSAPLELINHKQKAVRAAIKIQRLTKEISDKWKETCGREIITRVGINSGPAVVGNMGSEGRFDYTAIGDTVNLASRLEATNKNYGTRILFSETTKEGLPEDIVCNFIDEVKVKGKTEAVKVYNIKEG